MLAGPGIGCGAGGGGGSPALVLCRAETLDHPARAGAMAAARTHRDQPGRRPPSTGTSSGDRVSDACASQVLEPSSQIPHGRPTFTGRWIFARVPGRDPEHEDHRRISSGSGEPESSARSILLSADACSFREEKSLRVFGGIGRGCSPAPRTWIIEMRKSRLSPGRSLPGEALASLESMLRRFSTSPYARISRATRPLTSVRRKSRPP